MGKVLARGHSRVPVYSGNPKNIIGLLLVGFVFYRFFSNLSVILYWGNLLISPYTLYHLSIVPFHKKINALSPLVCSYSEYTPQTFVVKSMVTCTTLD
jgi:Mg2+/Co2+ transporter CorC